LNCMDLHRLTKLIFASLLIAIGAYLIAIPAICYADGVQNELFKKTDLNEKKAFHLSIQKGLLSLDAKEADVRKVLEEVSEKTGVEIEIDPNIESTISMSFSDLPLEDALKKIASNKGIVFSNKKEESDFKIIKVLVLASSEKNQADIRAKHKKQFGVKTYGPISSTSPSGTNKTKKRSPTSVTLINKKAGIKSKIVSNELIVRFKEGLGKEEVQSLIGKTGATVKTYIEALDYYVLSLPSHLSVNEALRWFRQQGVVEQAEPNYLIPLKTVPNDPEFSKQWSLHNTGQIGGADDADIDALEAWDIEQGKTAVINAIIDTGVDYTHEDLAANIWQNPGEIPNNGIDDDGNGYIDDLIGWDFVDSFGGAADEDFVSSDNDPMDRHGHGTLVAGIAGAVTNNDIGIAGVAWNCQIMPVRAGYKTQSGDGILESDDAAQAIIYAAENRARVINLSWGDYQKSNLIEDAIAYAIDKGALICAAAGNENSTNPIYPAASDNMAVLAIGATDNSDQKASFSNYGDWVHLSAPGVSIYSTYLNSTYLQMSGTSMATPHVAGVAALLFSYFPELSPLEGKMRIMRSVDFLEALDGKNGTSGRINAYLALTENYSAPHICSLTPNAAHEGDQISIFGDSFGTEQGNGVVKFYPEKDAEIISWNNSSILCRVPEGAQTGEVTVITSEGTSNGVEITILIKFYDETLLENEFLGSGQAQGWKADDESWLYQLPFSFPFFGQQYETLYVCSNGFLDFTNSAPSYLNSAEAFESSIMIAPLWDDLITNGTSQQGEDIYIYSPSADSVCFRWAGERYETGDPVNMEVILNDDGRIKFNYGQANTNLSPTIGISGGDEEKYHVAFHNERNDLNQVQTVLFTPHIHSFTISLNLGWNLISIPLVPNNNQTSQILSSISSGIESVWGYKDGAWKIYIPGYPEISDLEDMKTGYGYWIKTNREGLRIQVQGELKSASIPLTNGWNLVGFNFLQSMPVEEALATLKGDYDTVWGYMDGLWLVYDSHNPGFNDLSELEPGRGYWIKSTY
jgi:subtilisin family serine protease